MYNLLAFCLIVFVEIQEEVNAGTILDDNFKITKDDILLKKYVYVEPGQDTSNFEIELGNVTDYPIYPPLNFRIIIQNYFINVTASNISDVIRYYFNTPTVTLRLFNPTGINISSNCFDFYNDSHNITLDGSPKSKWTSIGSEQGVQDGSSYFSIKLDGSPPPYFALNGKDLKGYVPDPEPTGEPTSFSADSNVMSLILLLGVVFAMM